MFHEQVGTFSFGRNVSWRPIFIHVYHTALLRMIAILSGLRLQTGRVWFLLQAGIDLLLLQSVTTQHRRKDSVETRRLLLRATFRCAFAHSANWQPRRRHFVHEIKVRLLFGFVFLRAMILLMIIGRNRRRTSSARTFPFEFQNTIVGFQTFD